MSGFRIGSGNNIPGLNNLNKNNTKNNIQSYRKNSGADTVSFGKSPSKGGLKMFLTGIVAAVTAILAPVKASAPKSAPQEPVASYSQTVTVYDETDNNEAQVNASPEKSDGANKSQNDGSYTVIKDDGSVRIESDAKPAKKSATTRIESDNDNSSASNKTESGVTRIESDGTISTNPAPQNNSEDPAEQPPVREEAAPVVIKTPGRKDEDAIAAGDKEDPIVPQYEPDNKKTEVKTSESVETANSQTYTKTNYNDKVNYDVQVTSSEEKSDNIVVPQRYDIDGVPGKDEPYCVIPPAPHTLDDGGSTGWDPYCVIPPAPHTLDDGVTGKDEPYCVIPPAPHTLDDGGNTETQQDKPGNGMPAFDEGVYENPDYLHKPADIIEERDMELLKYAPAPVPQDEIITEEQELLKYAPAPVPQDETIPDIAPEDGITEYETVEGPVLKYAPIRPEDITPQDNQDDGSDINLPENPHGHEVDVVEPEDIMPDIVSDDGTITEYETVEGPVLKYAPYPVAEEEIMPDITPEGETITEYEVVEGPLLMYAPAPVPQDETIPDIAPEDGITEYEVVEGPLLMYAPAPVPQDETIPDIVPEDVITEYETVEGPVLKYAPYPVAEEEIMPDIALEGGTITEYERIEMPVLKYAPYPVHASEISDEPAVDDSNTVDSDDFHGHETDVVEPEE